MALGLHRNVLHRSFPDIATVKKGYVHEHDFEYRTLGRPDRRHIDFGDAALAELHRGFISDHHRCAGTTERGKLPLVASAAVPFLFFQGRHAISSDIELNDALAETRCRPLRARIFALPKDMALSRHRDVL